MLVYLFYARVHFFFFIAHTGTRQRFAAVQVIVARQLGLDAAPQPEGALRSASHRPRAGAYLRTILRALPVHRDQPQEVLRTLVDEVAHVALLLEVI